MISFSLALCCVAIICNFLEINYSGVKEALREATVTTGRSVGFKASLLSLPRAKLILPVAAPLCELGQRCSSDLEEELLVAPVPLSGLPAAPPALARSEFLLPRRQAVCLSNCTDQWGKRGAVTSHHHGPPLQ